MVYVRPEMSVYIAIQKSGRFGVQTMSAVFVN